MACDLRDREPRATQDGAAAARGSALGPSNQELHLNLLNASGAV